MNHYSVHYIGYRNVGQLYSIFFQTDAIFRATLRLGRYRPLLIPVDIARLAGGNNSEFHFPSPRVAVMYDVCRQS